MRKLTFLLYMSMFFILIGCSTIKDIISNPIEKNVRLFLDAVINKNENKAMGLLTEKARKEVNISLSEKNYLEGYYIKDEKVNEVAEYEIVLSQVGMERPYHRLTDLFISMDKESNKVDTIKELRYMEVYPEKDKVLLRLKNIEKPQNLFQIKDVLQEFKQSVKVDKNIIDIEGFALVKLSYDKKKLAFSTIGKSNIIGIYDFVLKKIEFVALRNDVSIENISWSTNHRYIAYSEIYPVGSALTEIYDLHKEKVISIVLSEGISYPEYSIRNPVWISKNEICLDVLDEGVAKNINKNLLGKWVYNVKKQKAYKINE